MIRDNRSFFVDNNPIKDLTPEMIEEVSDREIEMYKEAMYHKKKDEELFGE